MTCLIYSLLFISANVISKSTAAILLKTNADSVEDPTTGERMLMYREFATGLALQSAEAALGDANLDPLEKTFLVGGSDAHGRWKGGIVGDLR